MPNVLTPNAKQQFFDNNGRPLVGGKLFTYAAGTSTKLATTVSAAGANNANPIILDYRGECNVWIPPNVAYKFVLAPSTDTDPPTHAIWTVDGIVSSQLITLYGGVDTGGANAYVLNFTANFTTLTDGIVIYWIPTNTNTGASTLNVNGLGAAPIVDPNGVALTAGAIIANQITAVIYRSGSWVLLSVSVATGSFTGTLTGMTLATTGTVFYKISGGMCTLYLTSNITGTSNNVAMSLTGLPAVVRPTVQRDVTCVDMTDNGISVLGFAGPQPGGSVILGKMGVAGANVVPAGWTAAGTKGLNTGWSITYPL